MSRALRGVLAVLLGVIVGMVVIGAMEYVAHLIYPLPEGIDPHDMEALKAAIPRMPLGAFVSLLVAWGAGAFAGGRLAAWMASSSKTLHAMIVGLLLLSAAVGNMLMIPHPAWFWAVSLALFPLLAYAGARRASGWSAGATH